MPQAAYEHELSSPPSFCKHKTDRAKHITFICEMYDEMNIDTSSKYTSSSEFEFLSTTDPSVDGLSEREVKKRTDPYLIAPITAPEAQLDEVQKFWGATARTTLGKLSQEFDVFL